MTMRVFNFRAYVLGKMIPVVLFFLSYQVAVVNVVLQYTSPHIIRFFINIGTKHI